MWMRETCEESMACRAKPVLLQSKLASCTDHNSFMHVCATLSDVDIRPFLLQLHIQIYR